MTVTATYTVPFTADGANALELIACSIRTALGVIDHVEDAPAAPAAPAPKKARTAPVVAVEEAEVPKRGRGRPRKEPEVVAVDEDELDLGADDEIDDVEDEEDEPEVKPAAKKKAAADGALTLEGHIIPAFQKYADKHTREKAGKVLAKYKVKSVRDLPKDKYGEVLQTLKV